MDSGLHISLALESWCTKRHYPASVCKSRMANHSSMRHGLTIPGCAGPEVEAYGIPIKEAYHEVLFPEIADRRQADLFHFGGLGAGPLTPGNTIRKVYLCQAPARIQQKATYPPIVTART